MTELVELVKAAKQEYREVMDDCLCKLAAIDEKYQAFADVEICEKDITNFSDTRTALLRHANIEIKFLA